MSLARAVRIALLLSVGPVLALVVVDRAIVHWRAHWAWVAREVPPLALDPYRLEGILRSTAPGRQNVLLLGNSVTEQGFDAAALEQRFAERGLRFPKLTIGGAPALTFGMLAAPIAALEPTLALLVISPPSLRSRGYEDYVYAYDAREVPELFSAREWLADATLPHRRLRRPAPRVGPPSPGDAARGAGVAGRASIGSTSKTQRASSASNTCSTARTCSRRGCSSRSPTRIRTRTRARSASSRSASASTARASSCSRRRAIRSRRCCSRRERIAAAHQELAQLAAEDDFALVTREELPPLDEDDFGDWVHASARGRERLTAFLGDYLARNL